MKYKHKFNNQNQNHEVTEKKVKNSFKYLNKLDSTDITKISCSNYCIRESHYSFFSLIVK